jgi:hypothetical protein
VDGGIIRPDERVLRSDVASGAFLLGSCRKRWRLDGIAWPFVTIAVAAAPRLNAPGEWWFRFECSDYPQQAPTARPWDPERREPLVFARWPAGKSRVPAIFRPEWKSGACLYLPCDRESVAGLDTWRTDHAALMWSPTRGISMYVEALHELLNSSDYTGVRGG